MRHSHDYTIGQQFRRYFDIGAFMADADLSGIAAGGEGIAFVLEQTAWLCRRGLWDLVPRCLAESAAKFLAFHLGVRNRYLSRALRKRLSMHRAFWDHRP